MPEGFAQQSLLNPLMPSTPLRRRLYIPARHHLRVAAKRESEALRAPVVTRADPQHLLTSACYQAAKHLAGIRNSIKQVATSVEVAQ